jgi:hypothetical protein
MYFYIFAYINTEVAIASTVTVQETLSEVGWEELNNSCKKGKQSDKVGAWLNVKAQFLNAETLCVSLIEHYLITLTNILAWAMPSYTLVVLPLCRIL